MTLFVEKVKYEFIPMANAILRGKKMIEEKMLPGEWQWMSLEEILLFIKNGISNKQNGGKKGYPVTRIETISKGEINSKKIGYVDLNYDKISKYKMIEGDILFSHINSVEHIGKTAIYQNIPNELYHGVNLLLLRPNNNIIYPKYLLYFLKEPNTRKYFQTRCKKAVNQASLNQKDITIIKIPVPFKNGKPDIEKQQQIAAILEKAERLKEWRKEADRLTNEFLRSTFLEMFGDPVKNPKGWDFFKFDKVGSLQRGKSKHRPRDAPELLGGPYPLIQTGEVANSGGYIREYNQSYSEIGLNQSKLWPTGTLCITIAANIAKTGILTFDACFPDSIVGFTPYENVRVEYTQFWLSFLQKILEKTAPESAQKNINLKILSNLNIPIPSMELQNKFSDVVERVEQIREYQRASNKQIDCFFNILMQQAFKGELAC